MGLEEVETGVLAGVAFFHLTDLLQMAQTCSRLNRLVSGLLVRDQAFNALTVHGLDSSDHPLDLKFADWLICSNPETKKGLLQRFSGARDLMAFNFDEAKHLIYQSVLPVCASLSAMDLHNVVSLADLNSLPKSLSRVRLGLNLDSPTAATADVSLPLLTRLEIRGFPFYDPYAVSWLLKLLGSAARLKSLSINCPIPLFGSPKFSLPDEMADTISWDTAELFFLDIESSTEHSTSRSEREEFSRFVDYLFSKSRGGFPRLNTVTLNSPPSPTMWGMLAECRSLLHVVVSNIAAMDLKVLTQLVQKNVLHLQILVLKFAGKTNLHFDSAIQAILSASRSLPAKPGFVAPPLERLELEVVMDETSCAMAAPLHTLKAAATLRCRYRDNMFFRRSKFGLHMAFERDMCTATPEELNVASPMELFAEEMIRHTFDDPAAPQIEAEMINEWNSVGKVQRALYVEIYDEFVDRELRQYEEPQSLYDGSGQSKAATDGYCDVSATIANLRE